jgi:hypothetical protein
MIDLQQLTKSDISREDMIYMMELLSVPDALDLSLLQRTNVKAMVRALCIEPICVFMRDQWAMCIVPC